MASTASSWYTELDFDSYVLDLLLLGWCGTAAMVIMSVNQLRKAIGPITRQPMERIREPVDSDLASVAALAGKPETCQWFNTAMSWLYLHYYNSPDYLDQWVQSLNLQLDRLGGPVQNKVEKVQPSSLPPRILTVQCQTPHDGSVILLTKLESQDLLLSMFASQQTSEGVRLTNCVAHVLKLNGVLRLKFHREKKDVKVRANFDSRPEVKVEVTPSNPYQDPTTLVDLGVVESNIRHALALAVSTFTITKLLMPGDLSTLPPSHHAAAGGHGDDDDERFTAQRVHNKMAQVASFNQKMQQQYQGGSAQPTIHEVPPQSRPPEHSQGGGGASTSEGVQKMSVQPVRQGPAQSGEKKTGMAPLAGTGGL